MVLLCDSSIVHFSWFMWSWPPESGRSMGELFYLCSPILLFLCFLVLTTILPSVSFHLFLELSGQTLAWVSPSFFSHFALFLELSSAPVLETFLRAPPGAFPHVFGCRCFGSTPQTVWGRVLKSLPSRNQMGCVSLWGYLGT